MCSGVSGSSPGWVQLISIHLNFTFWHFRLPSTITASVLPFHWTVSYFHITGLICLTSFHNTRDLFNENSLFVAQTSVRAWYKRHAPPMLEFIRAQQQTFQHSSSEITVNLYCCTSLIINIILTCSSPHGWINLHILGTHTCEWFDVIMFNLFLNCPSSYNSSVCIIAGLCPDTLYNTWM